MKCVHRTWQKTTGRLLFAASLAFAGLGLISCGDGQGSSQKDSGANTNGGLDGAGRDGLRTDAPAIPDGPVTGPEAGIVDVGTPDQPVPDAAVRLDVQTTPDLPAIEVAITEKDAYEAPASLDVQANLDTSSPEPDLPLPPPPIPDAQPAEHTPDLAADTAPDVGPDMQPDVVDAQPDAPADLPFSDLPVPQGTGGSGGNPECVYWTDCAPTTETCKVATCSGGRCVLVDSMAGASCGASGNACNGRGQCVNHCLDTVRDSDESDVDCGGTCGATCNAPQRCRLDGSDCASGVCVESSTSNGTGGSGVGSGSGPAPGHRPRMLVQPPPSGGSTGTGGGGAGGGGAGGGGAGGDTGPALGYCQAPSCSDGVKNGDETDIDCGGSCSNTLVEGVPAKCWVQQNCLIDGDCKTNTCAAVEAGGTGGAGGGASIKQCQWQTPCETTSDCYQPFAYCQRVQSVTYLQGLFWCSQSACQPSEGGPSLGTCPHGLDCEPIGIGCKPSCANDADCVRGTCDTKSGRCTPVPYGELCSVSSPDDCISGVCIQADAPAGIGQCGCSKTEDCAVLGDSYMCNGLHECQIP
jgi:hypothetical protein